MSQPSIRTEAGKWAARLSLRASMEPELSSRGKGCERQQQPTAAGAAYLEGYRRANTRFQSGLDGHMLMTPLRPVKVHARGCAEVPAALTLERIVTGRVQTSQGVPASGVLVEAVPVRPQGENELPLPVDSAPTDATGRYELRNLRAGDYYLGVSLSPWRTPENPYTRWFYPGTEDPQAAIHVHVADRPERQSFHLTLPIRQQPRLIEGVVVWPD